MVYGVIYHEERVIRIVQAGHPPTIYLPFKEGAKLLNTDGTPVGLWPPHKAVFREQAFSYQPGDRLFLYSDGISEAFSRNRDCYTEERLLETLTLSRDLPLSVSLTKVMESLLAWSGKEEFDDDVTLCGLEFY